MSKKVNYGNWVPKNMLYAGYGIGIFFGVSAVILQLILSETIATILIGGMSIISLCFAIYMHKCRNEFSFEKGGLMGKVHEYILQHLEWSGEGELLDIGCGAGALTIRSAKKYPKAKIMGMDYWGIEWNYAKEQCEENARAEGVSERIQFQKGDAAKLDFKTNSFDAAVSNFVFHEVRSAKDKKEVVREALRVVKKGGVFAFQDMFSQNKLYGDMRAFVEQLKKEGIQEIHYIPFVEKKVDFIPKFITAPWMLQGIGLIYGMK